MWRRVGIHTAKGWVALGKMFWGRKALSTEETNKGWSDCHLDSEGGVTPDEMARQAAARLCVASAGHNEGLNPMV